MSDVVYRTSGPWGAGLGADLTATQVDTNFWVLYSLIVSLQDAAPNTISYFTVTGSQMWITMTDHYVFGPFTIPQSVWNFRGAWLPNNAYSVNDVFTEGGAVYLCIYSILNSGATFYASANDGRGHNFYGLLLAAPARELPNNGLPGQMLQWTPLGSPGGVVWAYIKRNIGIYIEQPPNPLEQVARYTFTESTKFAVNFVGSRGNADAATATAQVYEVYKNGVNIGSINFAAASSVATFTAPSVVTFLEDDVITVIAPSVPDSSLQKIAVTLLGVVILP
jgi:hypothetical protein